MSMSAASAKIAFLSILLCAANSGYAQSLLITNVDIVDVRNDKILSGHNILIVDGRIQNISAEVSADIPPDTEKVDATGQFVIPGLWDMHEHWYDTEYLPLYIANGVTGIREMSGRNINYEWRKVEKNRDFIGPKSIVGSSVLDGPASPIPDITIVASEEDARAKVREYFEKGADFIKIYNDLSREVYFAIADESEKLGIPFAGHIPLGVTALEASDAGQLSIEHNALINIATSDTYPDISHEYGGNLSDDQALEFQRRINEGYDGERTRLTYEKLASNGTWLTPTLTVRRYEAYTTEQFELLNDFLYYLPDEYASMRQANAEYILINRTPAQQLYKERQFEYHQMVVGDMHKAGVKLLAGTDGGYYCFPGCPIQDELELFVEAGLSPNDALRTATINAAEYAGRLTDFGAVEEGKIADLVLLAADPTVDIKNTRKIIAVVLNGRFHGRDDLDRMLEEVRNLPGNYTGYRPLATDH